MSSAETTNRPEGSGPTLTGRLTSAAQPLAALAAASLLGGSAALAGAWAFGAFDDSSAAVEATAIPASQSGRGAGAPGGIDAAEIYRRNASGVVQITTTSRGASGTDVFGNTVPGEPQRALGSGFVIDKEGHVVTNYHVIDGASQIEVSFSNQETVSAKVVGRDPSTDLALLEVDVDARALTPLTLADSDDVNVGDPVVAIGNPFGLERTVTAGIVSALQREVRAPNDYTIDHVIQTDAPINSGNSGGPLMDAQGRVIGVNSSIETANGVGGNVGIGFAVPSNTVKTVVAQLLDDGRVDRAFLGVTLQEIEPDVARVLRLQADEGVLVGSVQPGSPAAKAGLEGGDTQVVVAGESYEVGGDTIVSVDGKDVTTVDALREAITAHAPGDTVKLGIVHADGKRETVEVELGRVPDTTDALRVEAARGRPQQARPHAAFRPLTAQPTRVAQRVVRQLPAELDEGLLRLDRPLEPGAEAGVESVLARVAADDRQRQRSVVAEREPGPGEPVPDLGHRGAPPPRWGGAADGREHIVSERLELAHRGVLLPGRPRLELGVPRDRHAHEPQDHVGQMRRFAALLTLLRRLQLADERPHGRNRAKRLEPPAQPREILGRALHNGRDVPEGDDLVDVRVVVRMPEREVPHPAAVRPDHGVAHPERQDERADRGRREDRQGHLVGWRRSARVRPLERVAQLERVVTDVRDADDELDRRMHRPLRELVDWGEALCDRLGERVVVQSVERELPEPVRPERLLRAELDHELLEVVEAVEHGHHARERAGRRAVDPADAIPERFAAEPLEKAELEQQPVHATA